MKLHKAACRVVKVELTEVREEEQFVWKEPHAFEIALDYGVPPGDRAYWLLEQHHSYL